MSTSKGATVRARPQKHQNRTAFKNDLHDTSKRMKFLNSLHVSGVCKRCKDILDWKIKYKKYKMISAPRKCVSCEQKAVKHAYHVLCGKCAKERDVCAKCCKKIEVEGVESNHDVQVSMEEVVSMLKPLPERKRRTILRFISKHHEGEQKISTETMSHIQSVLAKMDNLNLDDDDDDDGFSKELDGSDGEDGSHSYDGSDSDN